MIRELASRVLYVIAEAAMAMGDNLSPASDEVWRDRRWKQYLRNEARLDSYEVPDTPWQPGIGGEIESPWRTRADDE
jgi:hypothetical protein